MKLWIADVVWSNSSYKNVSCNNNNNNNNNNNFSGFLLTCRINSTSAYCKVSTRTQIRHKTVQVHERKTLNRQNKNYVTVDKQYKRSTGTTTLNPEKA